MMLFAFLLGVLATWRLSQDYVNVEGPLGLYGRSRRWVKAWAERRIDASSVKAVQDHWLYFVYVGVDCFVCVSFWAAALVTLLSVQLIFPVKGGIGMGLLWWFGLAGGALVVERICERLKGGGGGSL